jgi:phosphoglycerate kinase
MIKYIDKVKVSALAGTVLLRLDFNTTDNWRMQAVIPTIKFLLKTSGKIVIVSHRGRPEGFDKKLSLKKDAGQLSKMLGGKKVMFVDNFKFAEIKEQVAAAPKGSIFLLDNLRFSKGEEANSPELAKELASLADVYVNDAFAVSHRANASISAITKFLPHYAGLELEKEIASLSKAMLKPARPLVLVLGGAKASDKLGVINYFQKKADWFLLGGGPGNTILEMKGMDIKKSVKDSDPESLKTLKPLTTSKKVILPIDFVWGKDSILDLGPQTAKEFIKKIENAGTIIWSGPLGLIEKKQYTKCSIAVAQAIGRNKKAFSVSGGGETVMFLKQYKLDKKFSFISTGGGAMIDFLAGKKLPGIEALK